MLPRGRVGVDLRLECVRRGRRLREIELCARRGCECVVGVSEGEVSMLDGVAVRICRVTLGLVESTRRMLGLKEGDGLELRWLVSPGECASICMGSGTPDLTQGRTV